MLVVAELAAKALFQALIQRFLTDVPERRVPEVVAEPDRLDQILVECQRARDSARDRRHLERMGQARAVVVAERCHEHLRLVCQAPERLAVHDPVSIALKRGAQATVILRSCALCWIGAGGERRELGGLELAAALGKSRRDRLRVACGGHATDCGSARGCSPASGDRPALRAVAGISRMWAWCSSISETARSTCPSTRSSPTGASLNGRPSASAMNVCAGSFKGKAAASQELHTTPPAAPEKPIRCSRSPQQAHAPSCGAIPAATSSFRRKASEFARVASSGLSSSNDSLRQSRLNTPGCGSEVSNRRPTASQARAAASSAPASPRRLEWPLTVCAPVTVNSSPRPSCSSICRRKNGSTRPPKRLRAPRTPFAIALTRPRPGV